MRAVRAGAHEQSGTSSTSVKQTESEATGAHEQSGTNSTSTVKQTESETAGAHEQGGTTVKEQTESETKGAHEQAQACHRPLPRGGCQSADAFGRRVVEQVNWSTLVAPRCATVANTRWVAPRPQVLGSARD